MPAGRKKQPIGKVEKRESPTPVPARDPPPPMAERVAQIVEMMRDGTFRTGVTVHLKAKEWGVSLSTASTVTAEASRHVRFAVDPNEITRKLNEAIQRLFELGETDREQILAISKAGDLCAQVIKSGIGQAKKPDDDDNLEGKSERELLEIIAKSATKPKEQ